MSDKDKRLADLAQAVEGASNIVPLAGHAGGDDGPEDPGEDLGDGGGPRGEIPRNDYGLPEGCPIIPLGKSGKDYYYLDALRQIIPLNAKDHSRNHLAGLFAPQSELCTRFWPRLKELPVKDENGEIAKANGVTLKEWVVVGFKVEDCADDLMDACARKGVWSAFDKIRGSGAWLARDGSLIFHCGNALWRTDGTVDPGEFDGFVYPSAPRLPRPADHPQRPGAEGGPAQEVLDLIKTWNWERGPVDAMLLLGWIAAAMVSGALDWRPMAFITGDKSSGKSTLHKLIERLFDGGIIQAADTTGAGLYQQVGQSSLPIAVDELEADADNRKTMAVIRLARLAASGAVMLRGGAEHKGVQFQARSCFLFSAILMPPLEAQDRSRMAILRLGALTSTTPPVIDADHFGALGRGMRRRLADQWPRFPDTFHAYARTLQEAGHDARGCDQFGTLLACADLVLFDEPPDADTLASWRKMLDASTWRELSDTRSAAESCLDYLAESMPEVWRGGTRSTVAELVAEIRSGVPDGYHAGALSAGGMAVVTDKATGGLFLAVGNSHRGAMAIFEGSKWAGAPGISGGWVEALARLPGAIVGRTARIGGRPARCVLVPVELVAPPVKKDQSAGTADAASPHSPTQL